MGGHLYASHAVTPDTLLLSSEIAQTEKMILAEDLGLGEFEEMEAEAFANLDIGHWQEIHGEKLSFAQKVAIKLVQNKIKRKLRRQKRQMDKRDAFAISALVTGLVGLITFGFFIGIAGVVLGALALRRGTTKRGMAIAGIVMGSISVLFLFAALALVITGLIL